MNNKFYVTNESIILVEDENIFSPVSELHYSLYENKSALLNELKINENIQCIASDENISFGKTQEPGLYDYADGIDIMEFLLSL